MDARNLCEAQFVDLVGRHIGCGIIGQAFGIIAGTIGKAPDTVVRSSDFLLHGHFGNQGFIGWLDRIVERLCSLLDQKILFNSADAKFGDLGLEIGVERGIGTFTKRRAGNDVAGVADDIGVNPFGWHDALGGACLGRGDGLIQAGANTI